MDISKAAYDLALYQEAAADWARIAQTARGAQRVEAIRKAMVYQRNADQIQAVAGDLLKAFPIKKRVKWRGMNIAVENPAGSERKWKDDFTGETGSTWMAYDYGYLRATEANDGDAVDVFLGPQLETAPMVYVVRQMRGPDFRFYDEDKCMLGFTSPADAKIAYGMHYNDTRFLGTMDAFTVDDFLRAVKATKKAPGPVGGWLQLRVPQKLAGHRLLDADTQAVVEAEADFGPMAGIPANVLPPPPSEPAEADFLSTGEYGQRAGIPDPWAIQGPLVPADY